MEKTRVLNPDQVPGCHHYSGSRCSHCLPQRQKTNIKKFLKTLILAFQKTLPLRQTVHCPAKMRPKLWKSHIVGMGHGSSTPVLKEWHDMGQLPRKHAANSSSTVRRALVHRNAWTKPHSGKKCCQIMKELQAEATKPRYIHNNIRPSKAKSQTSSTLIYYSYIFWLKK